MGLTISSLFSRLFGKKQMRILMGEYGAGSRAQAAVGFGAASGLSLRLLPWWGRGGRPGRSSSRGTRGRTVRGHPRCAPETGTGPWGKGSSSWVWLFLSVVVLKASRDWVEMWGQRTRISPSPEDTVEAHCESLALFPRVRAAVEREAERLQRSSSPFGSCNTLRTPQCYVSERPPRAWDRPGQEVTRRPAVGAGAPGVPGESGVLGPHFAKLLLRAGFRFSFLFFL